MVQYVGVCNTFVPVLVRVSGYGLELIVSNTVSYQWFHKPLKRRFECLKKVSGVICEVQTSPGSKTETASQTTDILFKKTTLLQGKPMMTAM